MVEEETREKTGKFVRDVVGYVVVIGVIILITLAIVFFIQYRKVKATPGRYAEDIKENVLYKVTKVLDGDTLTANVAGHEVTLRLIGIDTPEVVDPRKPVQCFGPEASAKAKELLSGKEIYIEKETSKGNYDKYGRVLAYIKMPDNVFYNQYMIENGFAREYTFNSEKYKYQKEFRAVQKEAKKEKKGLWSACPI